MFDLGDMYLFSVQPTQAIEVALSDRI